MNYSYSFGEVGNVILFGGGQALFDSACHLKLSGLDTLVVTSQRHHDTDIIHNNSICKLNEALRDIDVTCFLVRDIDSGDDWKRFITPSTIGLSLSAEWIFRKNLIDLFNGRLVNLHGSALPNMKGGGGASWNLMMGLMSSGVTIHFVDEGIDTGDILIQDSYDFPANLDTLTEVLDYSSRRVSTVVIDFLDRVRNKDTFTCMVQDVRGGSYWPRLDTNIHGYINWSWTAKEIVSFIKAFGKPYLGARTFLGEKSVRILGANSIDSKSLYHPFQYGIIFNIADSKLFVACNDGVIVIDDIVDDSDEKIALDNALLGSRFFTPLKYLETAMKTRVKFIP